MDENPYHSPRETGYQPPAKPAFNYVNAAVTALLAFIALTVAFYAYVYVVVALSH